MAFPEAWLSPAIEAATGCKAYPSYVPRTAPLPFVAFTRASTDREWHLHGNAGVPLASFNVSVYGRQYFEAKTLADRLRMGVDNFTGNANGVTITSTHISAEADGEPAFEPGEDVPAAYVVELTIEIRYDEAT